LPAHIITVLHGFCTVLCLANANFIFISHLYTVSFERAAAQAEAMEAAAAATAAQAKVNLVEEWDQKQQKILEQALVSFPRTVEERWVKIAECLPGKSKEDCMKRYKYLSSKVLQARKTKAAAAAAAAVKS